MNVDAVRVEIYRSFVAECRAPMPVDIARKLGLPLNEVETGLTRLHEDDVIALVPGTHFIWLAHPFSATDAPFRVDSGERRWDAICIWDALGVLALTNHAGRVLTSCPDCGERLTLEVSGEKIAHSDYVVHFEVPARRWYENIGHT